MSTPKWARYLLVFLLVLFAIWAGTLIGGGDLEYQAERAALLRRIERMDSVSKSMDRSIRAREDSIRAVMDRLEEVARQRDVAVSRANQTLRRLDEVLEIDPLDISVSDSVAARLALEAWRIRTGRNQ